MCPRVAWTTTAVSLVGALAGAVLAIANHASIHRLEDANLLAIVLPIGFAVIGLLIATRLRTNPIGWLFLFAAFVEATSGVAIQYARLAQLTRPGSLPGAEWAQWIWAWCEWLSEGAGALLLLLLPDGRLASPRWRPMLWAVLALTPLLAIMSALSPGPIYGSSDLPQLVNPAAPAWLGFLAHDGVGIVSGLFGTAVFTAAAAAPIVRIVRSRPPERQQLKWIAFAVICTALLDAAVIAVGVATPAFQGAAVSITAVVGALGLGVAFPLATAVAIFKHRLYDIDVVISRTIVYGALAASITAIYVAVAVGLGTLIGSGGSPNLGLSILATVLVAVAFQPARERLQRAANRLVYGRRATPYEILSEFSRRVAENYALDEVLPRMARVLAEGTGAERAGVWLCSGGLLRPASSWPEAAHEPGAVALVDDAVPDLPEVDRAVAVRHNGQLLGVLTVTKRRGETLTLVEDGLLGDLARQACLVLRNVGLTAELLQRVDELRASRQRLVRAQDVERRRLERDLHDGAQQHLVALKLKLGLAETLAASDPTAAGAMLRELKTDADDALETLRDLAHGIYPPVLADRGLVAALEAHARRSTLDVTVRADGVGRYAAQIEACVYACCLEAQQNVQKHARARRVVVGLTRCGEILRFEVVDDGAGFDPDAVPRGAGLESMRDRVEALGGRLDVRSSIGGGTTVAGDLPLGEPAAG